VEHSTLLQQRLPLLPQVASEIGDPQVRNRGTIGGSLAHADPSADLPAAILALDAEVVIQGPQGVRVIPAREFFVDVLTTALQADEVLTAIRLEIPTAHAGMAYRKIGHPASHYAIVGVAAVVTLGTDGRIERAAVGVTGAAPYPYRAEAAEAMLQGQEPGRDLLERAAERAVDGLDPLDDTYASGEYRSHLVRVETRRALEVRRPRGRSTAQACS
jgi:carbon-monoxide dehydrogenase medium subunit